MPYEQRARLARDIQRVIGSALSDEQLGRLIDLKPLTEQTLHRFFQVTRQVQLKKGQAGQIVQLLDGARAQPATPTPLISLPPRPVDPDLAALATSEGRQLGHELSELLREVHFDRANRELRLPQFGGDYDIRPFPLPATPVDKQEMKVRLRRVAKSSRNSGDATLSRRIQQAFSFFMFGESLPTSALDELFGEARRGAIETGLRLGLFVSTDGHAVRMNELSLFSKASPNGEVIHVFADTPPHF